MAHVQGNCDLRFNEVQTLLQKFIESGDEVGASITVNLNGRNVVDLWGGYADKGQTRHWTADTIVNVFSCVKTVLSLSVLILVDRGLLDVNEKVSRYWPEFAANGKQDIEVRHFLSHTSGVSGWDEQLTVEDLYDFEKATARLAQQAPWWAPGTASGYHSITMGYLLGELVRRTTGQTLTEFVAKEIATPLNADFQIGALEKDWPRVTDIVPFPGGTLEQRRLAPDSLTLRTLRNPNLHPRDANTAAWRRAEIGAANGHGNARSLARILSVIALGGQVDGKRLLSEKTIDLIFQEQANGVDVVLGVPIRFGIGYGLTGPSTSIDWLPSGKVCYWGGWGGSLVIMDLDRRMTIAYAMNQMGHGLLGNERGEAYVKAIYAALKRQSNL